MRLVVLSRHSESVFNVERRVNGNPAVPVALTEDGERQAGLLGLQLRGLPIDLCIHTRFERTRRTAEIALHGRDVPFLEEPLLDDIDVGELDGEPLDVYRAYRDSLPRHASFPGGESRDDAAARYAEAFRVLAARPERTILVVCHEIPVRYALNGAAGSDSLDAPASRIPNATPFMFEQGDLALAAARIAELAR